MEIQPETVTVKLPDGTTLEHILVNGAMFPTPVMNAVFQKKQGEEFAEHQRNVLDLTIRDDDILLTTFPRSGTHWTWELTSMLLRGNAEYNTVDKNYLSIDFFDLDVLHRQPSPRLFDTHLLPRHMPRAMMEKGTKILHVRRNPKDVLVSLHSYLQTNFPTLREIDTFDDYLKYFTGENGAYPFVAWVTFVKKWDDFTKQHPDQVLTICYEDIKEDPAREVKKINEFLNCDRSDELIEQIVEACSFVNLKKADLDKQHLFPMTPGSVHRQGKVGDWKNVLTVAQNEYIDRWLEKNMVGTDLSYRYEL